MTDKTISVPTESRRPNRLCSNCGVELFANYQEAGWNHCEFDGLFACAGKCQCPANTEMLGEFAASSSLLANDSVIAETHVLVPRDLKCHKCGSSEPWKDAERSEALKAMEELR